MRWDDASAPRRGVPLAGLTSFGIGGPAAWLARAATADDLARLHRWCADANLPMLVLGGGSNLVIADRGFAGCVVRIELRQRHFTTADGDVLVTAGAGELWDDLVADTVRRGLAGLECLSGIPGSVGGTPIQNVGAYGQEVASSVERLLVYDRSTSALQEMSAAKCGFSYRMSRFKAADAGRFIICDVTFRLRQSSPAPAYPDVLAHLRRSGVTLPTVADVRDAVLAIRRSKGMVIDPADPDSRSVGSFFMNPVVSVAQRERIVAIANEPAPEYPAGEGHVKVPAAWLIERSGFHKGFADGAVGISSKHPLALVNRGGATAADVLRLATRIKQGVLDRFAVALRPEPVFAGFDDEPALRFLLSSQP